MSWRRLIPVLAAVILCAIPGSAFASGHHGYKVYEPPGKAGASEYAEVVPTASGGTKPPTTVGSAPAKNLDALGAGKRTARKLEQLGATGSDAANWARASAPPVTSATTRGASAPGGLAGAAGLNRGSVSTGLFNLLSGSDAGGIGLALPLLLGLGLAASVGYLIGRRAKPVAR
jgi:hypothetical protein